MKNFQDPKEKIIYSIPFALLVVLLSILCLVLLSYLTSKEFYNEQFYTDSRALLFLLVIPLVFISASALYLYLVVSNSIKSGRVSKLSLKLFFTNTALILATLVPGTLIVVNLVSSSISTWFDHSISDSLYSALTISDDYIELRKTSMEKIASTYFNGLAITNYIQRNNDWMNDIRTIDPSASSCQVYLFEDSHEAILKPILESGNSDTFFKPNPSQYVQEKFFVYDDATHLLRLAKIVRYAGKEYFCVLSSELSETFKTKILTIEETYKQTLLIDRLKPQLPFLGVWVFFLFCVPMLLLLLALAWLVSISFCAPISTCAQVAISRMDGKNKLGLLTGTNEELSLIAESINQLDAKQTSGE